MTGRVLFYVQHLLGVGHLKRAETLSAGMRAAGLHVTLAFGGRPTPDVPFAGIEVAQLPPATIANENFSVLLDGSGRPVDDNWKAHRRDALLELFTSTDPDVVLIELFPFGRRQFRFELLPLLDLVHSRESRSQIACSVRDILVSKHDPRREAEIGELVRRYFDAVLVHGDPALIGLQATFPAADRIADLTRYTGYVSLPVANLQASAGNGEVIVSAGGGAVGEPLLLAALAARPLTPVRDHVWRFLTGPNLPPEAFERLASKAGAGAIVERFRPDFPALLHGAALSISQAGYNTTMDLLRSAIPAVVIPYETASETEQRLRSELLAGKELLTVVPAAELSPERLAQAISAALAGRRRSADLNLSGAENTAAIVCDLVAARRRLAAV